MAHTVALADRRQCLTSRSALDGLLEQRHQLIARRPAQFRLQRSHIRNVVHGQSLTRPQEYPGAGNVRGWFSGRSGPAKSLGAGFSRKMADQNVGWRTDFNSLRREVTQAHHE